MMESLRNYVSILYFLIFLFVGSQALASQEIVCPQVNVGNPMTSQGSYMCTPDQHFNVCVIQTHANDLHNQIRLTMIQECETERRVYETEREFERISRHAQAVGSPMPQLNLDPNDILVMSRINPQRYYDRNSPAEMLGSGPARSDSCLNSFVQDTIIARAADDCNPLHVQKSCTAAFKKAEDARTAAAGAAERARGQANPVAFAQAEATRISLMLPAVADANDQCSQGLIDLQARRCSHILSDFFENEDNRGLIARNCTHRGLQVGVNEAANSLAVTAKSLHDLSIEHINNRQAEDVAAAELRSLAILIQHLQNLGRNTANAGEQGHRE